MTKRATYNADFTLREPQKGLLALLASGVPNVLAAGSSRVGKSWLLMLWICLQCIDHPGSRHGVFRRNRNACEANLFKITLPQVLRALGLSEAVDINKSDLTAAFPGGSIITFNGLDEHQRDRILGSEFQTIWMNEVSEFIYEDVEFLRGRLYGEVKHRDTGKLLPKRMFFDCNPDTFDDWDHTLFKLKRHPITRKALLYPEDYGFHRMITDDEEYIRRNADQSDEWKERFIYANWTASNPNAIFSKKVINDFRVQPGDVPSLAKIKVGIDPAISANPKSDLTGIVVSGITHAGDAYVLTDRSGRYMPDEWARIAVELFDEYEADEIVAEANQGGDMVAQMIYQVMRHAPVRLVKATRGKEVRADPIAMKYRQGKVHHVGRLDALETEMCSFGGPRQNGKSPDRMDALVWVLWSLFDIGNTEQRGGFSTTELGGFYR